MSAAAPRSLRTFFILISILFSPGRASAEPYERLIREAPSKSIGIYAIDIATGREVLKHSEHLPLEPASVLKLLVSYAALKDLKPDSTFRTEFFLTGKGDHLDLLVKGGGDPSLTTESLYLIAQALHQRGIISVRDILLDDSRFEAPERKGARAYEASPHALSLNHNSIRVWACLGTDGRVRTGVDPEVYFPTIQSRIAVGRQSSVHIEKYDAPTRPFGLSGTLSRDEPCSAAYRSVDDIPQYFGVTFKRLLMHVGIKVTGGVRTVKVSDNAEAFYSFVSKPLSEIVTGLNHFSTNMIAETLLYAVGCNAGGCTREAGLSRLGAILKKEGAPSEDFHLEDASGLSHANKVSPFALLSVLKAGVVDPEISPEYVASFSVLGRSGTLKRRGSIAGDIYFRGKTGSLDGVSSLAGQLITKKGNRILLVLLENSVSDKEHAVRWEESVLRTLYDNE